MSSVSALPTDKGSDLKYKGYNGRGKSENRVGKECTSAIRATRRAGGKHKGDAL